MNAAADLAVTAATISLSQAQYASLKSARGTDVKIVTTRTAPTLRSLVRLGLITEKLVVTDLGLAIKSI